MSDIIAEGTDIIIRKMKDDEHDLQLYLNWMTDPQTMKYWGGMTKHFTYEKVVEKYKEHLDEHVEQCIIEYHQKAIGYCQFCVLNAQYYQIPELQYSQFAGTQDIVYGIDIFLGEVSYRNHGIGTKCLKTLMKALFENRHADVLMIDPKIHNTRAIRCYHKCGFRDLFVVPHRELQDGIYHDSLIMGIKKEDFINYFAHS